MSVRRIKAGSTDVSVVIRIVDSADGTPETGVVFNTAGIDLWYRRDLAASVDITEATLAALTTAHADGGFLHINDGWYRLDLPDAACATGVAGVQIGGTVTGMVVLAPYIELPVNTEEDVYTRLGAPAGASVSADIAAIEAQTDDIGVAGAGLTAVPWNAAWDAEVQSEVADALAVYDPPTKAELDVLGTTALATQASVDTIDNLLDTEIPAITAAVITNAAGADIAADIIALKAETAAILADTAEIGAAGAGLTVLATQASVDTIDNFLDTEIAAILEDTGTTLDTKINSILALLDDARTEPGQGAPPVNPDLATKIDYLYKAWRNKKDNDGTETKLYADDGSTVDQKQSTSEAAGTVTTGEWATGA